MKKSSEKTNGGLADYIAKYSAKALNIPLKSIKITPQHSNFLVLVETNKVLNKNNIDRLFRLLRHKNLKTGNVKLSSSLNKNNTKTNISFDVSYVKSRKTKRKIQASFEEHTMQSSLVLAESLAQNMRFGVVANIVDKELIKADASAGMGLKVMRHGDGARLVQTIYQDYVSDSDYTGFLEFFKAVDDVLYKFRGNKELDLNSLKDEDEDEDRGNSRRSGKRGRGGRKSFAPKGGKVKLSNDSGSEDTPPDPSDQSVVISAQKGYTKSKRTLDLLAKYYPKD